MRKTNILRNIGIVAGILVLLILNNSCEHTEYDLLDPAEAGIWTLFDTTDGLPSNEVTEIKRDSRDNLWFTFPGYGTAKYDGNDWIYFRTANSPLLTNIVNCLAEDADGKILFGTSEGISILNDENEWDSYVDSATSMYINTIKVASNGWIWVGTKEQGFYVNNGSGFVKTYSETYKNVNVIEEDAAGNIWLGTDNGLIRWDGSGYSYLTTEENLPNNRVSALLTDSKERLWIGTRGGKTASWIDSRGIHQLSLFTGTDSCFINDIIEDRKGDIWFATYNDGLIRFDGVIPHSIKEANGFPENNIYSIGEDKYGNLWFGLYSRGVARYTLPIN